MTKKKKQDQQIEILEDPNAIIEKANTFFSDKKKRSIFLVITGVVVLAIFSFSVYNYYITSKNASAQEEMFQAQLYFEADSLNLALNGDGNSYGFLEIIEEFPLTPAANLAHFYAGASYLLSGDFEQAITYLSDFSSKDYLMQARAYSLIGDAYMEQDDFENAIDFYEKAVAYKPNEWFTPVYLKKLALAHEQKGAYSEAAQVYEKIVTLYPNARQSDDAKKQKVRLQALSQ